MTEDGDADTFKILLATDNHLGYGENNPNIESDSFVTFEEILRIAVKEEVDFILLGGDLFHDSKPSPYCVNKCTELIRKYCFGDKCVEIEVLSDSSIHFHRSGIVNYEDPNMNISFPIFSIHGNHDDPTGKKQISAMDLMASMGLVNYFGRWNDVTQVDVNPVLLKKGQSYLALYGLSHIRDERLARLFLNNKVKMKTPENVNDWFNLMILHQNRANRGVKNFIADTNIPEFVDLVMWGHEHDCRIEPELLGDGRTYVTQPGSSVATSLAEGESVVKKVGLLRVNGKKFHLTPIELATVRPFIFNTLRLEPPQLCIGKVTPADKAKELIKREVQRMLQQAKNLRDNNLLPLIRLVVKYEDESQVFNAIRFGQEFSEQVANPEDVVKFSSLANKRTRSRTMEDLERDEEGDEEEQFDRVEDLISKYLNDDSLKVQSVQGMTEAVRRFIDASDADAPMVVVSDQEEFLLKKLMEMQPGEEEVDQYLANLQRSRQLDDVRQLLNNPSRKKKTVSLDVTDDDDVVSIDDDDDDGPSFSGQASTSRRGRGRGAKKAEAKPRGRGRGRAAKNNSVF